MGVGQGSMKLHPLRHGGLVPSPVRSRSVWSRGLPLFSSD